VVLLPHVLGVILITTGVTGCTFLDALLGQSPFDPDAPFPNPSAATTFTTGSATIKLADQTLALDELTGGGTIAEELGINATWTNGDGWYLTFSGYEGVGLGFESSYLSLNRIFEDQHWVTYDPSRCVTTTEHADATGITGTAICRGLEWSDWFDSFSGLGLPEEIEGEPAFDADITFEAH
jgi:hypothetical protein